MGQVLDSEALNHTAARLRARDMWEEETALVAEASARTPPSYYGARGLGAYIVSLPTTSKHLKH